MPPSTAGVLQRVHRRSGRALLRATRWSLWRGTDHYQGDKRDTEERWEFIRDELKRQGTRSLLDIGCAEGYFVRRAAKEVGCFGVGIEPKRERLLNGEVDRLTKNRGRYAVIRAKLDPETIRGLPHCDVVLCLSVLHHVINKGGIDAGREFMAALSTVARQALVFEMGAPRHPDFVDDDGKARSADEQAPAIRALLESAGFKNPRPLGRTPGYKGRYERDVFVAETASGA